ncbi:hypothetical protein BFW01_g5759 [Lasiodiplodia theobromae]|nr:hypothetical protein BFW01_g5759 [Lasiodiplodia theobromae]
MSTITETVAPTTNDVTSSAKQGLLYVGARFTNPDLRYEDWARWYDEIHMPHLASMSGCRAAMRYVRIVDPNTPQEQKQSSALPYLTLYPLHDVSWLHGDEFDSAKDSTEADYLPGRSIFKSVDFEGRGYELVGGSAVMGGGEGQGSTKFIVFTTFKSAEGNAETADSACVEKFYGVPAALPGCRGMSRYRYCDNQRPEMAAKHEISGQWPARDLVIHGLDMEKLDVGLIYRARDEVARQLSDPSALDVAIYELATGLDG